MHVVLKKRKYESEITAACVAVREKRKKKAHNDRLKSKRERAAHTHYP
jgi:hypothetical protein